MNEYNCRVCGLDNGEPPWGEDGNSPTYGYCSCCGVEFGNKDYTLESIRCYRKKWINEGAKWFFPKERPPQWDINEQLKNIPGEFV